MKPSVLAHGLLPLLFLLLTLPGCGVIFIESFNGTELFKHLKLQGDFTAGSPLDVSVDVTQTYPVPVRVACYYDREDNLTKDQKKVAFQERATLIGDKTFDAVTGVEPGDKVAAEQVNFRFTVPEPGSYFLACITPAAPDNGIGKAFSVGSASTG